MIELGLGTLVWFRELRYPVLLAGLCLHLGIEYAMNIPLFEWISIATYAVFIYPEDLSRAGEWIRHPGLFAFTPSESFSNVEAQRHGIA